MVGEFLMNGSNTSTYYLSEKAVLCLAKQFVQAPNAYTMGSKDFVGCNNTPLHLLCHDIPVEKNVYGTILDGKY